MGNRFFKNKKHNNPFIRRTEKAIDPGIIKKRKKRLGIFIGILILAGVVYFVIYASCFEIKKIAVSGSEDIDVTNKIQIITKNELVGYRNLVIPKNNILFFDKNSLEKKLRENLVLEKLVIKKQLFNTLKIEAEEKLPAVLWDNNGEYFYIDKQGVAIGAVKWEEVKYDLPMVSRGTTTSVVINTKLLDEQNVSFIREAIEKMRARFSDWQIRVAVAQDITNREIYFYTTEGWYVILNTEKDIDKQLDNLEELLKQKLLDRKGLEYIDLRLEEKIFYK
jgi:cell division septal protein FtsQ